MKRITVYTISIFIILISCNKQNDEQNINQETHMKITNVNLAATISAIKTSDIYENPKNWQTRGLMPSNKPVVLLLRKATNDFLDKLEEIYKRKESSEEKLELVSEIVDELPWDELDTEEKEFLADTLTPAIKAAGLDPVTIF
ncbi:hypothetical protein OMO38_12885 [Chryseobacterium sp. 09-1422]|uniref:DUF4844 domain-containing protein n=1 Tax=Chryseobacterium kimseyorum TaxID=2984028 RepID=A0ABT3I051_9FLAO|nr:hypothetical protein [Chryseobacterium kimseyorum]MCW3169416.1 hypothetical protein [Chryseobacterium kimseyorum]